MPFEPSSLAGSGSPPTKEPHLGVVTSFVEGRPIVTPLPPGAVLALIMDPSSPEGIELMGFIRVTKYRMDFKCACLKKGCTKTISFKVTRNGRHPK